MDMFKHITLIILCCLVVKILAINANQKLRQFDKRLTELEINSITLRIDTDLKFEDMFKAINILNESQCEAPISTEGNTDLGVASVDVHEDTSHKVQHIISRFQLGFAEEKTSRKLAVESMKQEMATVEDELRNSIEAELRNVNKAIKADRNNTISIVNQFDALEWDVSASISSTNQRLNVSVTAIEESIASKFQVMNENVDGKMKMNDDKIEHKWTNRFEEMETSVGDKMEKIRHTIQELSDKMYKMHNALLDATVHHWNKHTYMFVPTVKSFDEAAATCALSNAHLVDIHSVAEGIFISSHLDEMEWWIGLSDRDEEGVWTWHHTNERASYGSWRTGEPNNYDGEDCVIITKTHLWNDVHCDKKLSSICKIYPLFMFFV